MCICITVNSDGKVLIKVQNGFLSFIIRKFQKAEAYFIRLKCIVVKQIISERIIAIGIRIQFKNEFRRIIYSNFF